MNRQTECLNKISAIRLELTRTGKSGVLIREQPNFSWVTAGGRGFLGLAATVSCGWVLVTADHAWLLANSIEGRRLMNEELPADMFELRTLPWEEDGGLARLAEELAGDSLTTDADWRDWFAAARVRLTLPEQDRFRALGRDAADALESVLKHAAPGIREFEAAGLLSSALWGKGIEPISLFTGADERGERVRHFIPSAKRAKTCLIASVCARRGGLIVSATRTVCFGSSPKPEKYRALLEVEAETYKALEACLPLAEVYQAICTAYTDNRLDGEWLNHHQGGLTGYLPREIRIDGGTARRAASEEAYAFNLSCPGAKVEDTVLLVESRIEVITACGDWPVRRVGGRERPDILVTH